MRTLYQWLLRLYPPSVRREFGDEMLGVFDEASQAARQNGAVHYAAFCVREINGLLTGTRLHRGMIQGAVAGVLIALAAGYAVISRPVTSSAVLRVVPAQIPERFVVPHSNLTMLNVLPAIHQVITSRSALMNIMHSYELYTDKRASMPDEDVVELMRKYVAVESTDSGMARISFSYPNRILAQKVTADLVSRFMTEYVRERTTQAVLTSQFLKEQFDLAGREWEEAQARLAEKATPRARLDTDIARQRYEAMSARVNESRMTEEMERRMQGPVLELFEPASLPRNNNDPAVLWLWAVWGALAGGILGWLISLALSFRKDRQVVAQAR